MQNEEFEFGLEMNRRPVLAKLNYMKQKKVKKKKTA